MSLTCTHCHCRSLPGFVAALCFISFFPIDPRHVLLPIDACEALVTVVVESILVKESLVEEIPHRFAFETEIRRAWTKP